MSSVGSDEEDLTRKQRREQARAERKAAEEAAAANAARRKRLAQLGGTVAVVVVAIVVILIATSGGGKSALASKPKSAAAQSQVKTVDAMLAGTTQNGAILGSATAPVTLQYFGDLECPICAEFTLGALPSIIQKWVKSGKLKIEYRSFSTATGGAEQSGAEPEGMFNKQQEAALAAGKQNKAWYYIELFYHEQGEERSGYVTESFLQGLAQQVPGLNLSQWTADRGDAQFPQEITTDAQEANNKGLTGTPSFFIGKSGGSLKRYEYTSLSDPSGFYEAFEAALKS
jgi:protein-disulfide isomerase